MIAVALVLVLLEAISCCYVASCEQCENRKLVQDCPIDWMGYRQAFVFLRVIS